MYRFLLYITFGIFFSHSLMAQISLLGNPDIKSFSRNDYRAGTQNWAIDQNKTGVLYFGNNYGLLEYDGTSWNLYGLPNRTNLRSLKVAQDDKIYVGGQNEIGYFYYDKTGMKYASLTSSIPEEYRSFDDVWQVHIIGQKVYFHTYAATFIYDGVNIRVIKPANDFRFSFNVQGNLYLEDRAEGLSVLVNDQELIGIIPPVISEKLAILNVIKNADGSITLITERQGIFIWQDGKLSPLKVESPAVNNLHIYTAAVINFSQKDKLRNTKYIALGTVQDGLVIIDFNGKIIKKIDSDNGLPNNTVLKIFQDKHENIWLGLDNGICFLELASPFSYFDEKMKFPGTPYAAIYHHDQLYIGTNQGLFIQKIISEPNGSMHCRFLPIKGGEGQVWTFSEIDNQLLCAHHDGILQVEEKGVKKIADVEGAWKIDRIPGKENLLICGTYNGFVLLEKKNGQIVFKNKIEGFKESSRIFEWESDSVLWMTHGNKGVYKITFSPDFKSVSDYIFYGNKDGFPTNLSINVTKIDGEMVFSTEYGMYVQDENGRFKPFPKLNQYLGDSLIIRKLIQDRYGNIWFSQLNNIGILLKKEDNTYKVQSEIFNPIGGSLVDGFENIYSTNSNGVLIFAQDGLVQYNPDYQKSEDEDFYCTIRRVDLSGGVFSNLFSGVAANPLETGYWKEEKLPYQNNHIKFTYASPYFSGRGKKMLYSYCLEGFDTGWSPWTESNEKEYTFLREGTYTFKVKAKNVYNKESNIASYSFIIQPPFYRTSFAYFLYLMAFMLLIGAIVRFLSKKHQKEKQLMRIEQQRKLFQQEKEFLKETTRSNEEIIRLKNQVLTTEINFKNEELASSTMHLVHKSELLQKIKNQLNSLMPGFNEENKKLIKEIVKTIDNETSIDENWKNFRIHFDSVHGDFLEKLSKKIPDLTPRHLQLCAYLRMNLSSKEIASLMNISYRSVELSRYRLRKKLGLPHDANLVEFIMNFND